MAGLLDRQDSRSCGDLQYSQNMSGTAGGSILPRRTRRAHVGLWNAHPCLPRTRGGVVSDATSLSVGVVRESRPDERRVALVPRMAQRLIKRGLRVVVESGAGEQAAFPDEAFTAVGATIGDAWHCDLVAKVARPTPEETARLDSGTVLVGFLEPLTDPDGIAALRAAGVTALAMESLPRISRAQAMDALSSQSSIAGYRAV